MEVKINLNEKVKFKLSECGKEIYRHRYDGYGFEYDREPKLDDDGYMSMQLWTFMQIFGEHMTMGMSEVVQPLEIIYEQENAPLVEPNRPTEEIVQCEDAINRYSALAILDPCSIEYKEIKALPSILIRSQMRPKGEWIFNPKDAIDLMFTKPKCSNCGFESADGKNFCSNCGAEIKGVTKCTK